LNPLSGIGIGLLVPGVALSAVQNLADVRSVYVGSAPVASCTPTSAVILPPPIYTNMKQKLKNNTNFHLNIY
jgi:hypothetical protein